MIRYDTYKDSGIEWLGEIPQHWVTDRLKNVFSFNTGLSITKKNLQEKGIPCVNYGEIHSKYGFEVDPNIHPLKCVDVSYLDTKKKSLLSKGDFVFSDTSEDIKGSGNFTYLNSNVGTFAGYHTIVAKLKQEHNCRFVAFLMDSKSFRSQFQSNVAGIKVYSITQGLLRRLNIFFPPLNEQSQIANYLDKKTKGIDLKIELLTKKISTYKELRKSLIKETSLQGLDKNVKLIDSNINWLGSYPAHWQLKRIKDIFTISRGRVIAKTELKDNGLYPVYSSQTQNNGELGCIDTFDFDTELLTWTTDGANAGTVFKRAGKFSCTNICGTLIPIYKDKISLDYFVYSVQESATPNKRIDTNGAKIMSNEMSVIDVVVPPLEEQKAIANYLDEKTSKIDTIVNNIENQINHLKELRKALINDVVTGKIKAV